MAKKLSLVTTVVEKILRTHPEARDDDFLLYAFVLNNYGYSKSTPFWEIRSLVVEQKTVPSMESVGRCRRKLQEMYEELHAVAPVEKGRRAQEPKYQEYAREYK